ncbi:MAG TPA: hypothetical protein VGL57_06210 [Solirubrobacteraceae bacterium]|jgi:hypothetical protein
MTRLRHAFLALPVVLLTTAFLAPCARAEAPVKEIFSNHLGWEVSSTGGNICSAECKLAVSSSEPGGFEYPEGVAVAAGGDLYVADQSNFRIQKLSPAGSFLLMFGKEVNDDGKSTCSAGELAHCKAGVQGAEAGGFLLPGSVAVEPAGSEEDVYVQDYAGSAVDRYTAEGVFVDRIGKEVDETKVDAVAAKGGTPTEAELEEEDVCTAASHDVCKEGVRREYENPERMAFNFDSFYDVLTVVGPEHLLYVGDGSRIQEFKPDGQWSGEIQLASTISSFGVDEKDGVVYVLYGQEPQIHEYDRASQSESLYATVPNALLVRGIAVDPSGRIAVSGFANGRFDETILFGDLYEAGTGRLISGIRVPGSPQGFTALSFGGDGKLYGVAQQEILVYTPEPIGEVAASPAVCAEGPANGSSATFDCTLNGNVNPQGVAETEALFQWGKAPAALLQQAGRQSVGAPKQVEAVLEGVHPHETRYYQLVGYDQNVKAPEQFTSETLSLSTSSVPPKVLGGLDATGITDTSAVIFGELNPENTSTTYAFQYAPVCASGEACPAIEHAPGMLETTIQENSAYGQIGTTAEVIGLQPQSVYRYRLTAKNENGEAAINHAGGSALPEGTFTTGPAPAVQATTGAASAVTSTTAVLAGTVNPDGQPATYVFELGVYAGAGTAYGVVHSGPVSAQSSPVAESEALAGLQPGTTYAYRLTIRSGYGEVSGAVATFTTEGLPAVLASPPVLGLLPTPSIAFPAEGKPAAVNKKATKCAKGKKLTHDKCAKAKPRKKTRGKKNKQK